MKKLFFIPLVCLFFLTSCVYTPVNNSYKIRYKGLQKDCSSLNNPVIFSLTASQEFSQGGKITKEDFGSVHFIYDWENNEVYDYVFSKNYPAIITGFTFLDYKNSDGTKTYLDSDVSKNIIKLNLKEKKLSSEKLKDDLSYYKKWATPSIEAGKYALLFSVNLIDKETYLHDCKFYIFSENSCKEVLYPNIKEVYDTDPIIETNGNTAWFIEKDSSGEYIDQKNHVKSLDLNTGFISDPFASFDSYSGEYNENSLWKLEKEFTYSLRFADDNYLILNKNNYTYSEYKNVNSIVIINRTDKTSKEISLDSDKNLYIYYVTYLKNKYYIFARETYGKYYVYTIDPSTDTLTPITDFAIKGVDIDSYLVRGNSIYFIDNEKNTSYISKFDVETNTYEDLLTVKVSDYMSNN